MTRRNAFPNELSDSYPSAEAILATGSPPVASRIGSQEHAPARQVLRGGLSDDLLEAERKYGPGHARTARELREGPGVAGLVVHRRDGSVELWIGERGEPARPRMGAFGEVQAEGLDEHHVRELLHDE